MVQTSRCPSNGGPYKPPLEDCAITLKPLSTNAMVAVADRGVVAVPVWPQTSLQFELNVNVQTPRWQNKTFRIKRWYSKVLEFMETSGTL